MNFDINKNLKNEKIGHEAYVFNNFLDDFYILIMMALFAIIVIWSFFFILTPRFTEIQNTVQSVEGRIDDEKSSIASYIGALTKYRDNFQDIDDTDKNKIDDLIGPINKNISVYRTDLMINFRDLLLANNFNLKTIDVQKATAKTVVSKKDDGTSEQVPLLPTGVFEMGVNIEVVDMDYYKLKDLLVLIENKSRLADVQNIDCDDKIEICKIFINTYYFGVPEEVKK